MSYILPQTELLKIKTDKNDAFSATFTFEPLAPGYGLTIGHALRRVLLASLEGAAVNTVKIEGATHEFASVDGVKEDVIEIIFNLKSLRLKVHGDETVTLKLNKKGPGIVTAADFAKNSDVEIMDPKHHIATLDKKGKLNMEVTVKKGRGYEPIEARGDEKMPLGTIAVDSVYTPIKKIHYDVENTRVGSQTDFDKLTLDITTDGTIEPEEALKKAAGIIADYVGVIGAIETAKPAKLAKPAKKEKETKKSAKKSTKTKK